MKYEVSCSNCEFSCKVQSPKVADLTKKKHEREYSGTCTDACNVDDVGYGQ